MDWKSFFFGVFSVVLLILVMVSIGTAHIGSRNSNGNTFTGDIIASSDPMAGHHSGGAVSSNINTQVGNIDNSELPEKCRVPAGQDINSWIEHLGHHAETQDCLEYFN